MLFEVALIEKPTKKAAEEGASDKLVLPPTPVIATNGQAAGIQAVMDNKDKLPTDLSRVEVLIRPFP